MRKVREGVNGEIEIERGNGRGKGVSGGIGFWKLGNAVVMTEGIGFLFRFSNFLCGGESGRINVR